MDPSTLVEMASVAFVGLMVAFGGLRQINQWETALKFTLGKLSGRAGPGLNFVLPGFQRMVRVDMRVRNRDLPQQSVITGDNVTAWIDAVIYYKVIDAERATLNVQDYENAVRDRAKVVLRDVVGETTLDELLAHREEVAAKVRVAVEQFVSQWGLHVELIALQDIQLPPQMQETIAKKAIAERDRQYVIIKSQADVESAKNFAEAARILYQSPGAMELRRLEALQNLSSGTSKVIFDLAKPAGIGETQAAAMAAAMGENVRVADGEPINVRGEEDDEPQKIGAPSAPNATPMNDEALRRRALERLGPLAAALAREALETGVLEVERDVLQWEGTLGAIHGNRVTLVTPLQEEVLAAPAVVDALTAAIAAASEGHDSLAELVIAHGERLHGSPYRGR